MGEREQDRNALERFLLGSASEEERQELERRLFADDELLQELQALEDDLLDDYAHGRLGEPERERLERRFATPGGQQRLAFARAASRLPPPARRRIRSWWPAAAAAVLTVATTTLGLRTVQLGQRLAREQALSAARERDLQEQLAREQARTAEPAQPPSPSATLSLGAPASRDGGATPELAVPQGGALVALAVPVEAAWRYVSYAAVIRTAEGALVWEDAGLRPATGQPLTLTLAADVLPAGDYILTLSGRRRSGPAIELADHYFRVVRR